MNLSLNLNCSVCSKSIALFLFRSVYLKTLSGLISQTGHLLWRRYPVQVCVCIYLFFSCLQFKVDGEWWTWIDYERFQKLIQEFEESEGTKSFSAMDYMAKTPSWALFGAGERGFDPSDTRFQRKNKTKDISGC